MLQLVCTSRVERIRTYGKKNNCQKGINLPHQSAHVLA